MMDRALKERTIGAIVLVAFAILVVPVFLDGPSTDSDTVTETVTLPGQNDQARRQQTIVLERERSQPVPAAQLPDARPAAANTSREKPAEQSAPPPKTTAVAAKAPATDVVPKSTTPDVKKVDAKPADASVTGMWAVQLGSFSDRSNAERLAANLRDDGYAAFLSQLNSAGGELHRVRIGPQKDRDSAESVATKLGSAGHKGQVVPHP